MTPRDEKDTWKKGMNIALVQIEPCPIAGEACATMETAEHITGEQLAIMDERGHYELIKGILIPMSLTGDEHAGIEVAIILKLAPFVQSHNLGKIRSGEAGVYTGYNPDTVRGVDILFISHERYAMRTSKVFLDVAPDLIIEIFSPGNTWAEMNQKLREFFAIGVRMVWIVYPKTRRVYVYRSITHVREVTEQDELEGEDVLPGFSVKVADFFTI